MRLTRSIINHRTPAAGDSVSWRVHPEEGAL